MDMHLRTGLECTAVTIYHEKLFAAMRSELEVNKKLDFGVFTKEIMLWEDNWVNLHEENIPSIPSGNSIKMAKDLWEFYDEEILNHEQL